MDRNGTLDLLAFCLRELSRIADENALPEPAGELRRLAAQLPRWQPARH